MCLSVRIHIYIYICLHTAFCLFSRYVCTYHISTDNKYIRISHQNFLGTSDPFGPVTSPTGFCGVCTI